MVLTVFIVGQVMLDLVLIVLLVVALARHRPRTRSSDAPPEWYQEFLRLTEDLLQVTEPVLAALESPIPAAMDAAPPERTAPVRTDRPWPSARYRAAFSLLRAGGHRDEAARRGELLPRELRLIESLLAAESRLPFREK